MSFLFLNFLLAALPSLLLLLYFYKKDKQRRESLYLIWKTFAFGVLAVLPVAGIEFFLSRGLFFFRGILLIAMRAFIIAGFVEELSKFLVVRLFLYPRKEFDEIADGIVYTITASLGFAFMENLMYSFGPVLLLLIRGITAVPLHAIASGIMGYYIGASRFRPRPQFLKGLLYATAIHGLYNFLLFTGTWISLLVIPLLFFSGKILLHLYRVALKEDRLSGRS
ncbi:MAG: protease PrsW [Spirochaetes bacterium]|nr:MAG: protease PrsW [Spirochaetota bacterium]